MRQYIAQFVQSLLLPQGTHLTRNSAQGPAYTSSHIAPSLTVRASRPCSCLSALNKLPIKSCGMSEHEGLPFGHSPCSADLHAGHVGARREELSGNPPGRSVNRDGSMYPWQRKRCLTCSLVQAFVYAPKLFCVPTVYPLMTQK